MTLTGIDIAWDRPTVAQIKATGAEWVARYFSNDDNKDLHPSEVTAYTEAGLAIVTVFETTAGRATAGFAAGAADARNAEAQRKAVGLPADHIQHFAVDKDVSWAAVAPYFDGVISVIGLARTGCYGGIDVINGAYLRGIRFLWQTVAWSEGRWNPHATIRQTGGTTLSGGADWDTAETADFGQYPRPTAPPQENDVQLNDNATAHKGVWTPTDQTATVEQWLTLGNLKAGATFAAVKALTAQIGALTAAVAALAQDGGLPLAQVQAAAEAGAKAALAELGHSLDGTTP